MIAGYVAFEGADGSGKSFILQLVRETYEARGTVCLPTKLHCWLDPWSARVIVQVRELLLSHPPDIIQEAYLRDLTLQQETFIDAGRRQGLVLQDRCAVSAAVYLEVLHGIPAHSTLERCRERGLTFPDLIVLVTVDSHEAYRRVVRRAAQARYWETERHLAAISERFCSLLLESPLRWLPPVVHLVNSEGSQTPDIARLLPAIDAAVAGGKPGGPVF